MKAAAVAALIVLAGCAAPEGEDAAADEFVCTTNAYDLTECVPAEPGGDGV